MGLDLFIPQGFQLWAKLTFIYFFFFFVSLYFVDFLLFSRSTTQLVLLSVLFVCSVAPALVSVLEALASPISSLAHLRFFSIWRKKLFCILLHSNTRCSLPAALCLDQICAPFLPPRCARPVIVWICRSVCLHHYLQLHFLIIGERRKHPEDWWWWGGGSAQIWRDKLWPVKHPQRDPSGQAVQSRVKGCLSCQSGTVEGGEMSGR